LLCLARCLSWGWGVVDAAGGAGAGSGGGAVGAAGDPAELLRSLQGGGGLASLLGGAGGLGAGAGAGAQGGMAEMTAQLLEDPNMRDQMINMMTQPGMIDMIASSNPQLGQMINSMPMIRQTMQNPEMLRAMLNPDMMRMMAQFSPGMVSTAGCTVRWPAAWVPVCKQQAFQSSCHNTFQQAFCLCHAVLMVRSVGEVTLGSRSLVCQGHHSGMMSFVCATVLCGVVGA
jgi:hypothetical protein